MKTVGTTPPARSALGCERLADNTLVLHLAGHWTIHTAAPAVTEVQQQLDASPPVQRLAFETRELAAWDSRLLTFLRQVLEASAPRQLGVDQQGLPDGVRRLLALAAAVPEREGARRGGASHDPAGHLARAQDSRLPPAGRGRHHNRGVMPEPGPHSRAGERNEGSWEVRSIRPRLAPLLWVPSSS